MLLAFKYMFFYILFLMRSYFQQRFEMTINTRMLTNST